MDEENSNHGSGGSTPVQDEPIYHEEGSPQTMDLDKADSDIEMGSDNGLRNNDDDEYVSDGGEVEREEVEQDIEEDQDGPASPGSGPASPGSGPASPGSGPASPGSGPNSPDVSPPASPDAPASPAGSETPLSPTGSYDGPASPAQSNGSRPGSPTEDGPASPNSAPASPVLDGPASPGDPVSPTVEGPQSPLSAAGDGPKSPPMSPVSNQDGPVSPAMSDGQVVSGPASPTQSGSPASPAGSHRSRSESPAGSHRSRSGSPAGSHRSRSGSPAGSHRSRSGSPAGSHRSRSGSPAGSHRSRSRSPAGSHRSRSGSPAGSHRSRSRSPAGSHRSRSGSPARRGSESEEETKVKEAGSDDEHDSDKDELIADIFGSSDEDEEFEGFGEADIEAANKKKEKKKKAVISDDEEEAGGSKVDKGPALPELSSDDEKDPGVQREDFVSDFDLMMMKKKEEMKKRRRKRGNVDIINDNDDLIVNMIVKMKESAEADRELNNSRKPAVTKLKFLPLVVSQLRKTDLHSAFLDCGILGAMVEWLAPLPDKSLPHLQIRESFLKILQEFPAISSEGLKNSGIGKAVMYLYKHPRETKENKERAGKLINDWSRPIFNLTSNFKMLSREERQQRDLEQLPKRRRLSAEGMTPRRDIDKAMAGEEKALRPGDKGWVMRARVPMPSHKDYVVRPSWGTEEGVMPKSAPKKKELGRYEKHARSFAEKKKFAKGARAITISIEGRNMAL